MTIFPSDEQILKAAQHVDSPQKLWAALPEVRDFQAIRAACKRLGIKFDPVRKGTPRLAQACPKPVGKGSKAKGGGE